MYTDIACVAPSARVATVVGALAAGESFEEVQQWYSLARNQVLSALRYAAHVTAHLSPSGW